MSRTTLSIALMTLAALMAALVIADVEKLEEKAKEASQYFAGKVGSAEKMPTVGVLNFTYEKTGASSPLLDDFFTLLMKQLREAGKFRVIEMDEETRKRLLKEQDLIASGVTTTQSQQKLVQLWGADYVLSGKCSPRGRNRYSISLKLTDQRGESFTTLVSIEGDVIDEEKPIKPQESAEVVAVWQEVRQQLSQGPPPPPDTSVTTQSTGKLIVTILPDRGVNATYHEGDEIKLAVWANKDCYIWIHYIDATGKPLLIFPPEQVKTEEGQVKRVEVDNFIKFSSDPKLKDGIEIPREEDEFAFKVKEPFGSEMVVVHACTHPLPPTKLRSRSVGSGMRLVQARARAVIRDYRDRGMEVVEQKKADFAEAACKVTTVSGKRGIPLPSK